MKNATQRGTGLLLWIHIGVLVMISGCSEEEPRFVARMVGDQIFVDVVGGADAYYWTCMDDPVLEKRDGDRWVAPRDYGPPAWTPGHFLDDRYVFPSIGPGCDAVACVKWPEMRWVARAVEQIKVGTRDKPDNAPDLAASPVDVFESRPLSGQLRVRVTYSTSSSCGPSEQALVPITVPQEGVCCPLGSIECSSEGPGGGWAPTLDACPAWSMGYDVGYEVTTDIHGCDQLREDPSACCGCDPGNDAGL